MAKHHFSSLGEIITYCTEQKLPFALYSLPDEQQIHCIMQDSAIVSMDESSSFPSSEGFILYPFQYSQEAPAYFIRAEYKFSFLDKDITKEDLAIDYKFEVVVSKNKETLEASHCEKVALAIESIHKAKFEKAILSRMQRVDTKILPVIAYIELFKKYPSACVVLVYIPGKTLWLCATPELLISSDKDEVKTMAIAGTKKIGMGSWSDKEREEQQIVTDYIYEVLKNNCLDIIMAGPEEVLAGNVAHLKTSFTAKLNSGLWDLVMELHPTPAVCGIPKEKALEFISKTELHKRKYYSGFLGPCNRNGETALFVNLRCAELSPGKADLYIGGGITANSVPVAEWEETVMKAGTLLSVLKPIATEKTV